ncbi:MAG: class I SAM-dependent methyltransferase [Magnetospirillum sp.]|nr:class I SAM-dependent methyltransferase [Magnetospirillum sp.]
MSGALISEQYRDMQRSLHENPDYGVASVEYAPLLAEVMGKLQVYDVLDYGAGKGRLGQELRRLMPFPPDVAHYDPAVLQWSAEPQPRDLVTCIDVLEHIEPDLLDNVLDHLAVLVLRYGFFTIHCGPAKKVLPDGRNAHLIQEDERWWLPRLLQRFNLLTYNRNAAGFWVVVEKAR